MFDVTDPTMVMIQVRFHPHKRAFMLTGSEDGLMCFFDTEVSIEEDVSTVQSFRCSLCPFLFLSEVTRTKRCSTSPNHTASGVAHWYSTRHSCRNREHTTHGTADLGFGANTSSSDALPYVCILRVLFHDANCFRPSIP